MRNKRVWSSWSLVSLNQTKPNQTRSGHSFPLPLFTLLRLLHFRHDQGSCFAAYIPYSVALQPPASPNSVLQIKLRGCECASSAFRDAASVSLFWYPYCTANPYCTVQNTSGTAVVPGATFEQGRRVSQGSFMVEYCMSDKQGSQS